MASSLRVGTISDLQFARDSSLNFFIGNRLVQSSPHRDCFVVSAAERLLVRCSICPKWAKCKLAWRQDSL